MSRICDICHEPYSRKGQPVVCTTCDERILAFFIDRGYTKSSARKIVPQAIPHVRDQGWDILPELVSTIRVAKPASMKVEKAPIPIDPVGKYITMVQDFSSAVACAKFNKDVIDKEAAAKKAAIDEDLGRIKVRLDEFTRINAGIIEPFLKALAAPVLEQKEIEKTRQQHADEAEAADAKRAEMRKEMVNSS